jgi:hypothetical protein
MLESLRARVLQAGLVSEMERVLYRLRGLEVSYLNVDSPRLSDAVESLRADAAVMLDLVHEWDRTKAGGE